VWIFLAIAALLGAVALRFAWRARLFRLESAHRAELSRLRDEQSRARTAEQNQQEAVLNSMVEGVLLLDEEHRIRLANRAFNTLLGLPADARGKTLLETLRLHELSQLVDSLAEQKQVVGFEFRTSHPKERWFQVNGAAVFDHEGGRQGTVLVFHDLTRLKQLESARTDFVANVSHELRTPLSLIKGYVETLLDGAKDNPEVAERFLRTIERNAERLKLLIDDLLTISELESGRLQLNVQPLNLTRLAEKVLMDFQTRAGQKSINLVNEVPDLTVAGDAGRLEQVLDNLVDNAIKYGREQGKVIISARPAQATVEVSVEDDGPGIPAESLERVFERFYRVDKARSREQGGTGLGLSIVKHIVLAHRGQVWAESEPGKGTTFHFTLPASR
jgi:two-component system phosphate regulon sensor histidine kinase PhoR